MSDDKNPQASQASHQDADTSEHQETPANGSGKGISLRLTSGETAIRKATTAAPNSPDGRDLSPQNAAAGYAAFELKRVRERIQQARNADELFSVANDAFGPNGVSGRFCHAQLGALEEKQFLELQRLMVQAELHDHLHGRVAWPVDKMNGLDFRGPTLWQVGHYLRHTRHDHCPHGNRQKKAAEARDALLKELNALFTQSNPALAPIKAQLSPHTQEQWEHYSKLTNHHEFPNRGDAGWFLGKALLGVLPIVATESKNAVFAAKLSGTARQLLKLAHNINTHQNDGAADGSARDASYHNFLKTNTLVQVHS